MRIKRLDIEGFKVFEKAVSALGLYNIPMAYNIGQTLVVAEKKTRG